MSWILPYLRYNLHQCQLNCFLSSLWSMECYYDKRIFLSNLHINGFMCLDSCFWDFTLLLQQLLISFVTALEMGKNTLLCLVTIYISLYLHKHCIACFNGLNDNIEGVLGRNVTLSCNTSWQCNEIRWYRPGREYPVPISGDQQQVGYNSSYLRIPRVGFHDDGFYQCGCYITGSTANVICSVTLKTICQATILLSRGTNVSNMTGCWKCLFTTS